jgi:hypothetical protein
MRMEAFMHDAFGWSRQHHFSGPMLAPLRDLNHRFLDLAAAQAGAWSVNGALGLPGELTGQLAPLSAAQRAAAASCPYALFDLRFHDAPHWQSRLAGAEAWRIADAGAVEEDIANFVRLVLFYAWHVAATPRLDAQILLGMTGRTAAAFRSVTLNCLPALVASEALNLSARWRACGYYWSALTLAAARRDEARLRKVQLFGLQIAAATLLP